MARRVYYRICDRPDGRFDAVVTIEPATVVRRDGFTTLAEVEEWIDARAGRTETARPAPYGALTVATRRNGSGGSAVRDRRIRSAVARSAVEALQPGHPGG
jgi:hypothetical protein